MQAVFQGLFIWLLIKRRGVRFDLFAQSTPAVLGLAVAGAFFCVVVVSFGVEPVLNRFFKESAAVYEETMRPYAENPVAGFVLICVLGPLVEELLARGFVLGGLVPRYGALKALLFSTLLFAAMHMNLAQGLAALVPAFVLGHLYLHTGSLFACVLMHVLYNAAAFVQLMLA